MSSSNGDDASKVSNVDVQWCLSLSSSVGSSKASHVDVHEYNPIAEDDPNQ